MKLATGPRLDYSNYNEKYLVIFIHKDNNMTEFDLAFYSTERDWMLFAKLYLVGGAANAREQLFAQHPKNGHPWVVLKKLLNSWEAPSKHCTYAAFQKLCLAKQCPDQFVLSFWAYVFTTCKGTEISASNKCKFLWTELHPEIRTAIQKGMVSSALTPTSAQNTKKPSSL
jgi:hypothetical protein